MHENIIISLNDAESFKGIVFFLQNLLLPILVAVLVYIVVDRLGEWRKRKMYSRLGAVIIESLQEEMRTGIKLMRTTLAATNDPSASGPPVGLLPNRSWSGMSTIPDEVLLRIVETSVGIEFEGLPPREIRSHCKNYFTHMAENYQHLLSQALNLANQGKDWRTNLRNLLVGPGEPYLDAALSVDQMLEDARLLLEKNSRRRIPK